jgi:hypothetical protein
VSRLKYGDAIKDLRYASGTRYEYRLEAGDFGRFGGIFNASRAFTLTKTEPDQVSLSFVRFPVLSSCLTRAFDLYRRM